MLPSTGKFKEINCPFFDSGLCERPYCHFRHVKRESSDVLQASTSAVNAVNSTLTLGDNGEILQQLVSEAVRKVLEQTDLPSALARPTGSNAVDNVSRNLVTKVAEVLVPPVTASSSSPQTYNVCTTQQKVPSYKPTPISVLKNRHIPIPYSPSLTKSCTVLRKRSSSDASVVAQEKLKKQEFEDNSKTLLAYPLISASKVYDPSNVLGVDHENRSSSTSDFSQYSPVPVKGWKDNGFKYTPSAIETLKQDAYVPSSSNSTHLSAAEYQPTEKLESAVEPTYVPLATEGCALGDASYEPSQVSRSEPEYHPLCCDNATKEYVPTDITELENIVNIDLDISPEIDLLHDLLHGELGSESDNTAKKKSDVNKPDTCSEDAVHTKHSDCDGQVSSLVENPKNNNTKSKSDSSKKKSESDKLKSDDKRRHESDRKEDSRKESENKRRDSSKRKSDSKKQGETSNNTNTHSTKKKAHSERKKEDSDRKRSESHRKGDQNERKQNDNKMVFSGKKFGEHHHKKSETVKKKGEFQRKKSENEVKKSDSDGKKRVSGKECSTGKHSASTPDSKKHEKYSSINSESKTIEKQKCNTHSEHNHNSSKSVYEKNDENRKLNQKHTNSISEHILNSHHNKHQEKKFSKNKEYSKSTCTDSKRKRSERNSRAESKKSKISHKELKFQDSKRPYSDALHGEVCHGNVISDSDGSDVKEMLDNVTLPDDTWTSSSDEDTVTKECYRIFQEYGPNNDEKKQKPKYQPPPPQEEGEPPPVPLRRRVAHEGAQNCKLTNSVRVKHLSALHPSQVLTERFQKVREIHAQAQAQVQASLSSPPSSWNQRTSEVKSPVSQPTPAPAPSMTGGKKRIAHVPNVSTLLDAKLKMQQKLKEQQLVTESLGKGFGSSTKAQTVPKGAQRVAHMPSEQVLTRPIVKGIGGKIPINVRQTYLDILVDEYIKISSSNQEAYEKAEEEEKAIFSRCTTRAVYTSQVCNTVSKLRKAAQSNIASTSGKTDAKIGNRTVSHISMLAGNRGSKGSWSIEKPRKPPASVVNKSLFESLTQFIMTEEQLKQNGFPMSHGEEKGVAIIHNFYKKPFTPKTPTQRMCARCSKIYYVNQQGLDVKEELCVYHWGRLFQSKTRGGWEARYNCCQGHGEAIGCSVGSCHVSDNFNPNDLRGFVKTLSKERVPVDGDYGVYALDCEMCYTTLGLELTRVTVIGADLNVVYESLVKPESTVLDYNTRFSGIKEEDLMNVTTNIYEVQSILLSFINEKTILIGHSLESDFKALKLIHSTVVDTSVVYPHKMGPPKKRALKTLCRDLLQKIIQESESGHDSAEDARAAMEIMLFKVKEDLKAW